ncbi:hypothetical protein ACTOWA_00575 [Herbaspirillum seropedicae]|uniref:hypothetical protein n=1 Tax=Herbaspirillum seropedicae TaxID=964 RepID=UPI00286040C4|nr:hypothetical protein [Herbaspirillum seropedicae]MDR6397912.1 hypothetical protein [Herbaspirillum seropedicae]
MPRLKKDPAAAKVQLNVLVSEETRDIFHRLRQSMGVKSIAEAVEIGAGILDAIDHATATRRQAGHADAKNK